MCVLSLREGQLTHMKRSHRSSSLVAVLFPHAVAVELRRVEHVRDVLLGLVVDGDPAEHGDTLGHGGQVVGQRRAAVRDLEAVHGLDGFLELLERLHVCGRLDVGLLGFGGDEEELALGLERLLYGCCLPPPVNARFVPLSRKDRSLVLPPALRSSC